MTLVPFFQGCEGRSSNPVSVLFDLLQHPDADSGRERPSLLEWRCRSDLAVDHVAIGRGPAGGCWQSLEGSVQTVSLGSWMELPGLKLSDTISSSSSGDRVKVSDVAAYYQQYIETMELGKNFRNMSTVISVREVTDILCPLLENDNAGETTPTSTPPLPKDIATSPIAIGSMHDITRVESLFDDDEDEEVARVNDNAPAQRVLDGRGANSMSDVASEDSSFCSCASPSTVSTSSSGCSCGYSTVSSSPAVVISEAAASAGASYSGLYPPRPDVLQRFEDVDESCARDGQLELEELASSCLSWDPIVNPELFCGSRRSSFVARSRTSSFTFPGSAPNHRRLSRCTVSECIPDRERIFEVRCKDGDGRHFRYLAENVVLATGSYDKPNRVGLPGEDLPFVLHSVNALEHYLHHEKADEDPVLVLGAGLSAADAVIMLRSCGRRVLHAFRKSADDDSLVFRMLPPALYPEYHRVYKLMRSSQGDGEYRPLAEHNLVEISPNGSVLLASESGDEELIRMRVSRLVILIGASPDLSFLDTSLLSRLGVREGQPINRSNPVDVDPFSCEAANVPNVYALGPLVGDNFVRFLQGGALAIAADILKKRRVTMEA